MITIAPIDNPQACDTDMLTLGITISSIVILLLQLSQKVVGNSRVFPVLPLTQKLGLALSNTQRPVTAKHMYWVKALIPCLRILANCPNMP